uniref:BED-type domain-containing protein n=1 Tax=Hordeum vulgare subsp. vulgare TaxID=112509 RepID=A0A8I6YBX4_HORVV
MHDTSHTTTPMDEDGDHIIILDDGEEGDDVEVVEVQPSKRKLTSKVWLEMKKMRINGEWKAKFNWCHKVLTAGSRNGTKHLRLHLEICTLKKLKNKGSKTLSQSSLKVSAKEDGKVSMEGYTFDQEYARIDLGIMLALYNYPWSMVDYVGFRRFVAAVQPLFKLHTRNTIRGDIVGRYKIGRKKAIEYMNMI